LIEVRSGIEDVDHSCRRSLLLFCGIDFKPLFRDPVDAAAEASRCDLVRLAQITVCGFVIDLDICE
jgi:hypothetical protein